MMMAFNFLDKAISEKSEPTITCESCGKNVIIKDRKRITSNGIMKDVCSSCYDEIRKKQKLEKKIVETKKKTIPDTSISRLLEDVVKKIDKMTDSMVTLEDMKNISIGKHDNSFNDSVFMIMERITNIEHILSQLSSSAPVSGIISAYPPYPSIRGILIKFLNNTKAYVSHYENYRGIWGVHNEDRAKMILYNLWFNDVLLRNRKNRYVINPKLSKIDFDSLIGEKIADDDYSFIIKSSIERMQNTTEDMAYIYFSDSIPVNKKKYVESYYQHEYDDEIRSILKMSIRDGDSLLS